MIITHGLSTGLRNICSFARTVFCAKCLGYIQVVAAIGNSSFFGVLGVKEFESVCFWHLLDVDPSNEDDFFCVFDLLEGKRLLL